LHCWGVNYDDLPRLIEAMSGDEKHDAASESTLDVLWVLYDRILRVDPAAPDDPDRDRFVLSKGHGPMAFYAVLSAKGFLDPAELASFGRFGSRLGRHPDGTLLPGVEIGSGSLGHGLGLAVGMVHGLRARGSAARVFCLVGDGELDEGSNHEAIAYAGSAGLDALTVAVVDNHSARWGWRGDVGAWFEVAGWSVQTVDGRDHEKLEDALAAPHDGRPRAVVAEVTR
jgi:transketolase